MIGQDLGYMLFVFVHNCSSGLSDPRDESECKLQTDFNSNLYIYYQNPCHVIYVLLHSTLRSEMNMNTCSPSPDITNQNFCRGSKGKTNFIHLHAIHVLLQSTLRSKTFASKIRGSEGTVIFIQSHIICQDLGYRLFLIVHNCYNVNYKLISIPRG